MGNTRPPVARRKKKKGRPSLLDLQRRSLRQQRREQPQEETQQRNPSADDDLRRPSSRRRPAEAASREAADDDDDDDDDSGRRKRAKKLRLVLRLPNNPSVDSAASASASASESDGLRTAKIGSVGAEVQKKRQNPASTTMHFSKDPGPTTPLPDLKLLVFILDRLQKKDTYGVFAEPVDIEELPDYRDIIDHPMDFATIRKKLSSGAYSNLEQFEKDVFLISSNAMRYNSPDTIYYRQARTIQELAKKNFENLRQESDDNEPEQKPVRRGRPPTKNIFKKLGRPLSDRTDSNLSSSVRLANGRDNSDWINLSRKGLDKTNLSEFSTKPCGFHNVEACSLIREHKSERKEDNSGSAIKSLSTKYSKKSFVIDENRRNTYNQPRVLSSTIEPSVLTTFDGEIKQLVTAGLYMEHAYARSLARFAAKLSPVGWEVASKRIKDVLPPGTKFGRGWVGDNEAPHESYASQLGGSSHSQSEVTPTFMGISGSRHDMAVDVRLNTTPPETSSAMPSSSVDSAEDTVRKIGSAFRPESGGGHGILQKSPIQLEQVPASQSTLNDCNGPLGYSNLAQVGEGVLPSVSPKCFNSEATRMRSRTPDMGARTNSPKPMSHLNMYKMNSVADPSVSSSSRNQLPDAGHDFQGTWKVLSSNTKMGSVPPDLNIGFLTPGSPVSGVILDSYNPNLSLQL